MTLDYQTCIMYLLFVYYLYNFLTTPWELWVINIYYSS